MSEYKRLTKRNGDTVAIICEGDLFDKCVEAFHRLAELEDDIENGISLLLTDLHIVEAYGQYFIEGKLENACCLTFIPIAKFDSKEKSEKRLKELQNGKI